MITNGAKSRVLGAVLAGIVSFGSIGALYPTMSLAATETRAYTWNDGENEPDVPNNINVNGTTFSLVSKTTPSQSEAANNVTQYFTHSVSSTASEADIPHLQSRIATSIRYEENGFSGTLNRTQIDYAPIYVDTPRDVELTASGKASGSTQPSDDIVPKTRTVDGVEATHGDIQWEAISHTSTGTPTMWQWTTTYKGTGTTHELDHYDVTTTYGGDLSKQVSAGTWSMTATYSDSAGATNNVTSTNSTTNTTQNQTTPTTTQTKPQTPGQTVSRGATVTYSDEEGFNTTPLTPTDATTNDFQTQDNNNTETETPQENKTPNIPVPLILGIVAGCGILGTLVALLILRSRKRGTTPSKVFYTPSEVPIDIESAQSELIMVADNGLTEEQSKKAELVTTLSPDSTTPTIISIPVPPVEFTPEIINDAEGNPMTDETGEPVLADYYIVTSEDSLNAEQILTQANNNNTYEFTNIADGSYKIIAYDNIENTITDLTPISIYGEPENLTLELHEYTENDPYNISELETITTVPYYQGTNNITLTILNKEGTPNANLTVILMRTNLIQDTLTQQKNPNVYVETGNHIIYKGLMTSQIKLDTNKLTEALNNAYNNIEPNEYDVQELSQYKQHAEDYINNPQNITQPETPITTDSTNSDYETDDDFFNLEQEIPEQNNIINDDDFFNLEQEIPEQNDNINDDTTLEPVTLQDQNNQENMTNENETMLDLDETEISEETTHDNLIPYDTDFDIQEEPVKQDKNNVNKKSETVSPKPLDNPLTNQEKLDLDKMFDF